MRRLPLLIAAVVAIVLASLVHGTPAPVPATAASASRAGFSPGGSFLFADAASQAAEVRTMTAAGARWIRLDIDWSAIETSRGTYNWARTDQAVNAARAGGMSVIGLLGYTPAWARPSGTTARRPPTNPADMAAFATVMAKRYGTAIDVWEVWNEPNLASAWNPAPDPAAYVRLFKPVSAALRAADAGSTILTGGISADGDDGGAGHYPTGSWVYALYQGGAQASFDGIAVHPYAFPKMPSQTGSSGFSAIPTLRTFMAGRGDSAKGIWITEFGSPTLPSPGVVTNDQQAAMLTDAFRLVATWPYVRTFLVYNLRDGLPTSSREQHFGLRTITDQPKPSWSVFTSRAPAL